MNSPSASFEESQTLLRCDSFTMSIDELLEPVSAFIPCTPDEPPPVLRDTPERILKERKEEALMCSSKSEVPNCLKEIEDNIASFVENLERKTNSDKPSGTSCRKKRPYFRKSKYPKEVVAEFEARKKIQKRERNRVLAAESRKRQKQKVIYLEANNKVLRERIEHLSKRLRLYEDVNSRLV